MQRIENLNSGQEGLALQDVSELLTVYRILEGQDPELLREVRGATDEAIGRGGSFTEVQLFGPDAELALQGLRELAARRIETDRPPQEIADFHWQVAARRMIAEYTSPGLREQDAREMAEYDQKLEAQSVSPWQERLVSWRALRRLDHKNEQHKKYGGPVPNFNDIFCRLAELELDGTAAGTNETSFSSEEMEVRNSRHSDRILVLAD